MAKPNIRAAFVAIMFQSLVILVFVPDVYKVALALIAVLSGVAALVVFVVVADASERITDDFLDARADTFVDSQEDLEDNEDRVWFIRNRARERNS